MSQLSPDQEFKLSTARTLTETELIGRQGEALLVYLGGPDENNLKVYVRQTGVNDAPQNILNRVRNFITSNTGFEVVFEPRVQRNPVN